MLYMKFSTGTFGSLVLVSFFPTLTYGISDAEKYPYNISEKGELIEFPISTFNAFGKLIPFSGGLFFRSFPFFFIKSTIKQLNKNGNPAMIYLHPWELDVEHPRISVPLKKRFVHYYNLRNTECKLNSLLSSFKCGTVKEVLRLN